jgi:hypothetical protein
VSQRYFNLNFVVVTAVLAYPPDAREQVARNFIPEQSESYTVSRSAAN